MVNQILVDYLKQCLGKYPLDAIKNKILSQGYPESEFTEALSIAQNKPLPVEKTIMSQNKPTGKKWMKTASYIGFFFLIVTLFLTIIQFIGIDYANFVQNPKSMGLPIFIGVSFLILMILSCFYYAGFAKLGRSTQSGSLRFVSISNIVLISIFTLSIIIMIVYAFLQLQSTASISGMVVGDTSSQQVGFTPAPSQTIPAILWVIGGLIVLLLIFWVVTKYIFSFALINIRNKVRFSIIAGITNLLYVLSLTILFGFVIYTIYKAFSDPLFLFSLFMNPGYLSLAKYSSIFLFSLNIISLLFESLTLMDGSKKFESPQNII